MVDLKRLLKEATSCEVRFDVLSRKIYSVDASIYEVEPLGIVMPRTQEDLYQAVKIACQQNCTLTPRGAATGITGGCLGKGLILDTSKYLTSILDIHWEKRYALVEPGVVQDALNKALAEKGFRLGPDTSTGDRATLGGMAGNNAAGARSLLYGKMVDAVEEIELILSSGQKLIFKEESEASWNDKLALPSLEGDIYRQLEAIRREFGETIRNHFPKLPRRASGYNLDELIKPFPINPAKLIVGSEGSLGVISKIKVKIELKPKLTALCLVFFDNIIEAMRTTLEMLSYSPIALEMIDDKILEAGRKSPAMRGKLDWLKTIPKAIFVAEFMADSPEELKEKLSHFKNEMLQKNIGFERVELYDPELISHIWSVRKAGLGLLLSKRSYTRAIAFIEDLSIPPANLAPFFEKFLAYLKQVNKEAGIYGHVGSGCMHIRPFINLQSQEELKLAKKMMLDIAEIVLEYGGAMSGEHGDGLLRSWLNEKIFGPQLYTAFKRLKKAFDPLNLMNPGKVVDGSAFEEDLRFVPEREPSVQKTFFTFAKEGGLALSADLCNGNGLCRKKEGLMCPSFQVTNDEYDSTRARANALRSLFNQTIQPAHLSNPQLQKILELCIECKGCKTECPSQVDMAKMKAEALYQYQEKYGYSLKSRLFAHLASLLRWGSFFPTIANAIGPWIKSFIGIPKKRTLPYLAEKRFSKMHLEQPSLNKSVILFNDTYNEFLHPEIGLAAIKVLNLLGYQVIILPWECCGRPLISKGFLKEAKQRAKLLAEKFLPYLKKGIPIVGIEPSCLLSFWDEYQEFLPEDQAKLFRENSFLFDAFLAKHLKKGEPLFPSLEMGSILIHSHCHQKALLGTKPTLDVLRSFPNLKVKEIPSGCCGMAGSFGYDHYDFSMKIGELVLFKEITPHTQEIIVANGFSCRTQIGDGTGKRAKHLAEFLAEMLDV